MADVITLATRKDPHVYIMCSEEQMQALLLSREALCASARRFFESLKTALFLLSKGHKWSCINKTANLSFVPRLKEFFVLNEKFQDKKYDVACNRIVFANVDYLRFQDSRIFDGILTHKRWSILAAMENQALSEYGNSQTTNEQLAWELLIDTHFESKNDIDNICCSVLLRSGNRDCFDQNFWDQMESEMHAKTRVYDSLYMIINHMRAELGCWAIPHHSRAVRLLSPRVVQQLVEQRKFDKAAKLHLLAATMMVRILATMVVCFCTCVCLHGHGC